MRLLHGTNIDFVSKRQVAVVVSVLLVVLTTVLLFTRGLNLGVDFAGGTEIQVKFNQAVDAETVRSTMRDIGFAKASVQVFGDEGDHEYLVRVERMSLLSPEDHAKIVEVFAARSEDGIVVAPYDPDKGDAVEVTSNVLIEDGDLKEVVEGIGLQVDEVRGTHRGDLHQYTVILEGVSTRLSEQLQSKLGEGSVDLRRVEYVGPQVGRQLRTRGFLSLFYACVFILIYLAIRFDFRFAPGAVVALAHDAFLTVGFYAVTGLEFNLTSIAAVLTIIGYSVNDTVVIYDRVRENGARYSGRSLPVLINQSVNETLSRTIITSGTTLLALAGLWFYAQGTIRDFAIAMTFGIVVGTYSTVFIASPMVLLIERLIKKAGSGEGDAGSPSKAA